MACDLDRIYGALSREVPTREGDQFAFSTANLPQAPGDLETDQLLIRKGIHWYDGYASARVDFLTFEARKPTYRCLALALLAKIFHAEPKTVRMRLTQPASDVREIVLDYQQPRDGLTWVSSYETRPYRFAYHPEPLAAYPIAQAGNPEIAMPCFNLTNQQDMVSDDAAWLARDVVRCAGTDSGHVRLAQVLLDLARAEEPRDEVTLESEHGNGGVARGSAEARFVLPGSLSWSDAI
jgi:hypothetical protein